MIELDALGHHPRQPALVHLARREDGILDHYDAHAALFQADGRLSDAHVGLEPDQDGRPASAALDPVDDLGRARQAEGRLDLRRDTRKHLGDRREGGTVSRRVLLGQDRRNVELPRHLREPSHARQRLARPLALGDREVVAIEPLLRVDDDEDAVAVIYERQGVDLRGAPT